MNRLVSLVALTAVGAAVLYATTNVPPVPEPVVQSPAVVGETTLYTLSWTAETRTALLGADTVDAAVHLAGTLAVTQAGGAELWQLRDLSDARFVIGDEATDLSELTGAVLRVPHDGGPTVHGADVTDVVRHVLTGLVLVADEARTTERTTPYGVVTQRWDADTRTTTGSRSLRADPAGRAEVVVTGTGRRDGDTWTMDETLTATRGGAEVFWSHDRLSRVLQGGSRLAVTLPPVSTTAAAPAPLETRAAPLSSVSLAQAVATYAGGGGPETAELMWRGTARLALDPALAPQLGRVATAADSPLPRRELALDLLAHTPADHAQAALREALPALRDDPGYPMFLSRLAFVAAPDAATAEVALADLADPGPTGDAAAHVVGSLVAHADEAGDTALGDTLLVALRAEIPRRPDAALAGLGNAGRLSELPTVLAASSGPNRRAAALALRAWHGASVRDALVRLAADDDAAVQRAALTALEGRDLTADLPALAEVPLASANLQLVATLVAPHADDAHAREILTGLLVHDGSDPRLRARVRAILR